MPPAAGAPAGSEGAATPTPPREGTGTPAPERARVSPHGAEQLEREGDAAAASAANDVADDGDELTDDEGGGGEAATGGGSRVVTTHALALSRSEWALLARAARKDPRLERVWEAIQTALAPQRPTTQPHEPAVYLGRSDRGGVAL